MIPHGENHSSAKLSEAEAIDIIDRARRGERLRKIAGDYPFVSKVAVHHVITGRRWSHLYRHRVGGAEHG